MAHWTAADLVTEAPRYFDSTRARDITARIGVVLTGPGGGEWTFVVVEGCLSVYPGSLQPQTASLRMAAADWVRLHTGELDGTKAFHQNRIELQGDLLLLQRFGDLFTHAR